MDSRLLKERQVLQYLQISHGTLWRLRQQGVIHPIKIGRALMFDLQDLNEAIAWLQEQTDKSSGLVEAGY
jgi:predicted DNA-binding transcriptional regulator AlpA